MAEPRLAEKQWDLAFEEEIRIRWEREKPYRFRKDRGKPVFVIDTPPPYPSGTWHIGAVATYSLIDMCARVRRALGDAVLFPFGLDRNGINIELVVERKYGKKLHEFDREEFIALCRKEIRPAADHILRLVRFMGHSCDLDGHYYETDSEEYRRFSQAIFLRLFREKPGLFYRGERPAFWCADCETTIAEADIEYQEAVASLYTLPFSLEDGTALPIATTRPELLPACRAVLVHPDDERFAHVHGKRARVPVFDQWVPILANPSAKPEFGTGVMMVCSYGDVTDIRLFRELQLEPMAAIGKDRRMTGAAGKYAGMTVEQAREAIVGDLQARGIDVRVRQEVHRAPVCERSKTPIEFIAMEDWYMRQLEVRDALKALAAEMAFHPDRHRQLLLDWIDGLTIDWPISRRRYYHTEIPLWYCTSCGEVLAPEPGKYYRPWKDPAPFDACPACGGTSFRGEDRVFDTWMDSSVSNLFVGMHGRDDAFFRAHFPVDLRPQGRDIVRNWLYYTTLKSYHVTGTRPFKHVFIHGMGLDARGRAMHRTLGNYMEPEPVLERHGADAFRFWAASTTSPGDDFRIDETKIAGARKFLSKLWNVARLISSFEEPAAGKLLAGDEWILAELNDVVAVSRGAYEDFNFFVAANRIRDFVWNVFAPHYLEMAKGRAYEGDAGARWTVHAVVRDVLRLLAPLTPFITEKIWRDVYGGSVHEEPLPQPRDLDESLRSFTARLVEFNSSVWKEKKERGLSLKDPLPGLAVPAELRRFHGDLARMHRVAP